MRATADISSSDPRGRPWGIYLTAAAVFAATVGYTIYACQQMSGGMEMPGGWVMSMMWMPMAGQSNLAAAGMFIAMWTAMMIAMMLPSAMPMILLYRRAIAFHGAKHPAWRTALMIGGYFCVWAAFGAVTFIVGTLLARLEMFSPALGRAIPAIAGISLIVCGIYQWTPWKASCLKYCQDPMSLVAGHLHGGSRGSLLLGLHHGATCAACCWSLMVIQIILGMMNLFVMAGIALVIAIEKLMPRGRVTARVVGTLSALAGIGFLVRAAWAHGFTT
jgi:predicted metal-binding membrane protein